eukprot:7390666-Prymnesium_polylepis.1
MSSRCHVGICKSATCRRLVRRMRPVVQVSVGACVFSRFSLLTPHSPMGKRPPPPLQVGRDTESVPGSVANLRPIGTATVRAPSDRRTELGLPHSSLLSPQSSLFSPQSSLLCMKDTPPPLQVGRETESVAGSVANLRPIGTATVRARSDRRTELGLPHPSLLSPHPSLLTPHSSLL